VNPRREKRLGKGRGFSATQVISPCSASPRSPRHPHNRVFYDLEFTASCVTAASPCTNIETRPVLKFDPEWQYDSPGAVPIGVVRAFSEFISKLVPPHNCHPTLEHFKQYFARADYQRSTNASWAQTDLDGHTPARPSVVADKGRRPSRHRSEGWHCEASSTNAHHPPPLFDSS
jgi:hypothetical protein